MFTFVWTKYSSTSAVKTFFKLTYLWLVANKVIKFLSILECVGVDETVAKANCLEEIMPKDVNGG